MILFLNIMKKEKYIDDVINNNLHKEIRFFLDKDLKEEDYKLSILMQNYYTLSDKRYIESIAFLIHRIIIGITAPITIEISS